MPTIKDLIRAALDNGKTVRQLEDASGGRVRFQTFQELSNAAPDNFPRKIHKTITGMALALGVSETAVVLAYAKGMGIHITTSSPFALRVPPIADRLDPAVQDAFLGLMRAVARNAVAGATESHAPDEAQSSEEGGASADNMKSGSTAEIAASLERDLGAALDVNRRDDGGQQSR